MQKGRFKPVEYKGYIIEYNVYGKGEWSVFVTGDDIICESLEGAKNFIDGLTMPMSLNMMMD